jgi:hypothetical protein
VDKPVERREIPGQTHFLSPGSDIAVGHDQGKLQEHAGPGLWISRKRGIHLDATFGRWDRGHERR